MRVGVLALALFFGCDAAPPEVPRPAYTEAPVVPPAPPPPAPVDARHDAHGIGVVFETSGRVVVTGQNRWGRSLDATYASADYFRRAMPVLERSVTPEQAAALRAIAEQHSADP